LLLPLVTFLEYLHLRKLKLHIPKLLRLRGDPFILRRKYPFLLLLEITDLRSLCVIGFSRLPEIVWPFGRQ
jgi:hypothetical protein